MVVLTSEEIEEFRADFESGWQVWPNGKRYSDREALLVTLEAFVFLRDVASNRLDDLITAQCERDTWRAEAEAMQADTDKVEDAYQEYRKRLAHYIKAEDSLEAERDTWRAEAEDRRAEVARLQDTVTRLRTETDYLRAKLCRLNTEPMRIPG